MTSGNVERTVETAARIAASVFDREGWRPWAHGDVNDLVRDRVSEGLERFYENLNEIRIEGDHLLVVAEPAFAYEGPATLKIYVEVAECDLPYERDE